MDSDRSRQSVLIVDDAPINLKVLEKMLTPDYEVLQASGGEEALDIACREEPDLILLDIMMPGMDGYSVCRRLKEIPNTRNIPVIFITARAQPDDEVKGLELGAIDYITKPFRPSIVKARVKTQIDLKRKVDRLERMVSLDGLTGIPNRRRFDQIMELEWRRGMRTHTPLSVIMMDIDFFKQFNDYYGHAVGDECLRIVAKAICGELKRPGDFTARYGGEEFVALLSNTNLHGAIHLAEAIRTRIGTLDVHCPRSSFCVKVTLSLGVACAVPNLDLTPDELIAAADAMLYTAKKEGRNRVCADVPDETE